MRPFFKHLKKKEELTLYHAKGCEHCNHKGYRGRTGIHELLLGTNELQAMIYQKAELDTIRAQALRMACRQ